MWAYGDDAICGGRWDRKEVNLTMSPSQQQAIRAKCRHPTGTFSAFAPEAIEQSIPDRFEHMVARHPERQAVKTGNLALTYAGLNQMANRVARAILARCGEGAEPVALLLAQGAPNIAAILGVLKAGKFYVPLDPLYPPARLTYMLEDSQAHLIVTDAQHLPVAEAGGGRKPQVLNLDELQAGLADDNLGSTLGPDTLAYLLYTSGSTGAPKGVLHNHRNVLHMVKNACNGFHLCAEDRLSLLYSPSVASAARTAFSALLNGATVLPYDLREAGLAQLASWLIQEEITCYNSVATVFRHFARTLTGEERFPPSASLSWAARRFTRAMSSSIVSISLQRVSSLPPWAPRKSPTSGGTLSIRRSPFLTAWSRLATRRTACRSCSWTSLATRWGSTPSVRSRSRAAHSASAIGAAPTSPRRDSCPIRTGATSACTSPATWGGCTTMAVSCTWAEKTFR